MFSKLFKKPKNPSLLERTADISLSERTADTIINEFLTSKDVYKSAAEKENEIWGKIFSDPEREKIISTDQEAARILGLNRDHISFLNLSLENDWKFEKGLSLACGNGRAERQYINKGICRSFVGIDISHQALEVARDEAKKANLDIQYKQADLNDLVLENNSFDVVITQNCLHHVLRLEHLADQILNALKPGGMLWVHDYVGETQFQHTDERLMVANFVLSKIPERYRVNRLRDGHILKTIQRKNPGTLRSPFEAIRSGMILPILMERFELVLKHEFSSILHLICPKGTRIGYIEDENGRFLFEKLYQLDKILIDLNMLSPTGGQYLFRHP